VPDSELSPFPQSSPGSRRRWWLATGTGVLLACLSLSPGRALAASQGSSGSSLSRSTIIKVQRALGVTADGIVGPKTRRAVRRFQRAHGLTVDGIIGPQTLAALGITSGNRTLAGTTDARTELAKIAQCESGGNPKAVSPDGVYRGKYQFTHATWRALGGKGDPAKAPERVQDKLAAKLYAARGGAPWPNCA
jgi:hypothetical protein